MEETFDVYTDFRTFPRWMSGAKSVEMTSPEPVEGGTRIKRSGESELKGFFKRTGFMFGPLMQTMEFKNWEKASQSLKVRPESYSSTSSAATRATTEETSGAPSPAMG